MLDRIYEDFTTKLLPKVAEGLTITKEYFFDLFGRYVKYLIITDAISLVISIGVFVLGVIMCKKYLKKIWNDMDWGYSPLPLFMSLGIIGIAVFGVIAIYVDASNIVKSIYIPEIRIYEQIKGRTP